MTYDARAFKLPSADVQDCPSSLQLLRTPYSVWVDILLGKIGPNRAFITRRLKIVGNMPRLLKTAKATERLVDLLHKMPTEFHGEYAKLSFG